jgi:hypothetical protein
VREPMTETPSATVTATPSATPSVSPMSTAPAVAGGGRRRRSPLALATPDAPAPQPSATMPAALQQPAGPAAGRTSAVAGAVRLPAAGQGAQRPDAVLVLVTLCGALGPCTAVAGMRLRRS